MKVDDLFFFLVFDSNWAGIFVETPFQKSWIRHWPPSDFDNTLYVKSTYMVLITHADF